MFTFLIAITIAQSVKFDKFDPGPNPNKSVVAPVIDFSSAQLMKRLKLEDRADEEVLKGIALKVKEWNFDDIDRLAMPGQGKLVEVHATIYKYIDYFDIKQLRPWLIKKAEHDGFAKHIQHQIKKLDEAKIEYALLDFDSKMSINPIYGWIEGGLRIGDMPIELRLIVSRNKYLLDVDELDQWAKSAGERRAKMKMKEDEDRREKAKQQAKMDEVRKVEAERKLAKDAKNKAEKAAIEDEEKADFLLKSAKRWLDENNKEVAERRINELLQRYPKSKSVAEAKKLLEKIKK